MKNTSKLIMLFLVCTAFGFSQSGTKNFIDQPFIEVTGSVETKIIPNKIFLKIILNENDKKGQLPIEKQENQMILTLKTLGINIDKNFSVLDFNGHYRRKFLGDNSVIKNKHYQLILNDGEILGEVYEGLDACDISNISITKTSHTELEKFRRETKLKALKTAKEKANDYAEAIGQTIGKALFIQETQVNNNYINSANALHEVNVIGYGTSEKQKIENLNLQPIILKEAVMAKFILN